MEVPVVGSDQVKWARVAVPAHLPLSEQCCSSASDMAGTAACSSLSHGFYIWRIHSSSPTVLELFGMDDSEASIAGVQLVFEEPLSPFISVSLEQVSLPHEGVVYVHVISTSGVLYILRIGAFYKYRMVSTLARSDIMQISLVNELGRLDEISALSGVGDNVCIGGKSGSILCYVGANLYGETKELYFELKDSDAILGRLWGLVARSKNVGPIQSLKLQTYKSRTLLFALHDDGTFKLWDLHNRSRLLNFSLYRAEFSGFIPRKMWVQEPEQKLGERSMKVAFLLQRKEANTHETVHIYDLQNDQIKGAGGQATLHSLLQTRVMEGSVVDLKLLSDRLWKLDMVEGQFHLNCYSTNREEIVESCEILEAELQDQLFQCPDDDWEEFGLFMDSINTGSKRELQLPISDIFSSRILQSVTYQRHTLQRVLQNHKRNIPDNDFVKLTREELQREILTTIETESLGNNKMEELLQWKSFCREYFLSWKQTNFPYSLMCDYQTGAIGLIRRHTVSFRRSLSNFEKVNNGYFGEEEFLDVLSKCILTIGRRAGRLPSSVFGQILLGKKCISVSHHYSKLLQFLDMGNVHFRAGDRASYIGVDVERRNALAYHQRHRKLELQLALDLQHLRSIAGGWSHVLDNIDRFILQFTEETMVFSNDDTLKGLSSYVSKRLVLKSTAQLSLKVFEAAHDLLMLLSYLIKMKGQVGISNDETFRIQNFLIVRVKNILLRGLLVNWLSTNFAEVTPSEDFSLHLSTLRLDNVADNSYVSEQAMQYTTLTEILLSSHIKILPNSKVKWILSSDDLLNATILFTSRLMWGENNDQNESLSSHSVTLASILLQHAQYTALQEFLRIVDIFCNELESHVSKVSKVDWCARLHLLGCGLLGKTRSNINESANKNHVEKAVHYFFRVASIVGEGSEDLSSFVSKIGMETTYAADGAFASWKFYYYEWVMQIFEQNHELEGACQFAHAALQEANEKTKYNVVEYPNETSNAVLAIKGSLWANIFKFSLDKKNYKEAYCAIMSNPDIESKHVCLRRFLIVLCERKAIEVLCGLELPYSGMLERVEQELLMKAQHSDINANPNPFKLLYSFHMQRSSWKRAALYMYVYSVRVKEMGLAEAGLPPRFVLQEQLDGLAAAINALHLVEPMHAWIDLDSIFSDGVICRPSSKRMRVYADNDADIASRKRSASYIDIQELEKEYTLVLAKICLIEADVQLSVHGDLSPENSVLLLAEAGLYEMAFTVLFEFWKNSDLKSQLERVFKIIAEKWCTRQQDNIVEEQRFSSQKLLSGSDRKLLLLTSSLDDDGTFEVANKHVAVAANDAVGMVTNDLLQVYLEKYIKLHPHLLVVVAETLLNIDRLVELPYWLVDMLKGGSEGGKGMAVAGANPSALFRIYLDFGRFMEATMLFVEYVKAQSNLSPAEVIKRKRMCGVWFPYTLVDRLQACLLELDKSKEMQSLRNLLESKLSIYFEQVRTDSSDVKSLVEN